ncbi:MAG: MGH1-like glycoside hydrolase domain-containing protein [Mycobacteriales bacterium]
MIPTVGDLESDALPYRFGDLFNPPGLTNFLGCLQVDHDLTGIRSLTFPPYSEGDTATATLFLDNRYARSLGVPVTFRWRPDRIERDMEYDGLRLHSRTCLVDGRTAALVSLTVTNLTERERPVRLRLALASAVAAAPGPWREPYPPCESDNEITFDTSRAAFLATARHSKAASLQGCRPAPDEVRDQALHYAVTLPPGQSWRLDYVHAVGAGPESVAALFDQVMADPEAELARSERRWNAELRAMFTPGNASFSGSLPVLETGDAALRRIYQLGALGVVYFRRDSPASVLGRTYDTLMPRYWQTVTFLWDYSLSSLVHAMLDPAVMRRHLEHWMRTDVHTHMGTEWLTGSPVGVWYSVNDHAMMKTARDYLAWSGSPDWLARRPGEDPSESASAGGRTVAEYLDGYATSWQQFQGGSGLADYGGIGNLLECVSSYVHEVASLNAANVANLRTAAELADLSGRPAEAARHRSTADQLAHRIAELYVPGSGYFASRHPDGRLVPVRHCYDFSTVLNAMAGDLTATHHAEMVAFFEAELRTDNWMHALSCADPDVVFSVRPDHQWTGAYPAWPPDAALALCRIGEQRRAVGWLQQLAASANQGPFGQAHFVDPVYPAHAGGARKAPPELPWITDWACSSSGAWVSAIVEGVFGVSASLDGTLSANPALDGTDPDSRLVGMPLRGRLCTVDRRGVVTT